MSAYSLKHIHGIPKLQETNLFIIGISGVRLTSPGIEFHLVLLMAQKSIEPYITLLKVMCAQHWKRLRLPTSMYYDHQVEATKDPEVPGPESPSGASSGR